MIKYFVILLLATVPLVYAFNCWTKSDTHLIDELGTQLAADQEKVRSNIEAADIALLFGLPLLRQSRMLLSLMMQTVMRMPSVAMLRKQR